MNKRTVLGIAAILTVAIITIASVQLPGLLRAEGNEESHYFLPLIRRSFAPQLEVFIQGLAPAVVTDIVDPGDGRLFIATRDGRILLSLPDGSVQPDPLLDISGKVHDDGNEMGLIGMAAHPEFAGNGYIYIHYTEISSSDNYSVIARYTVGPTGIADLASELRILHFQNFTTRHNGGALQFGPLDGYLYIAVGDGGLGGSLAQSTDTLLGKILRIDIDNGTPYSIPEDNPFVSDTGSQGEIWALGLRNPWRISFDRQTGDMYIGDVGETTWEEIDIIPAGSKGGENFGWPCLEGPDVFRQEKCDDTVNYTGPIFIYGHDEIGCGAVTAGYLYRGTQIPQMIGHFLLTDLCSGNLWGLKADAGQDWQVRDWDSYGTGFTTFGERSDGELFLANASNGIIYQIVGID